MIFLGLSRSSTQIESGKNVESTTAHSLFDISSAMGGVG